MRQSNAHLGFALMMVLLAASPVWAQGERDFGDAPEFRDPDTGALIGYPTKLVPLNGARHIIRGPWLGGPNDRPDPEADGQPHPQALGDDNNGSNDENGVMISGPLMIGTMPTITIEVNSDNDAGGTVSGWIDYNRDYRWDSAEQVVAAYYPNGTYNVTFSGPVPSTAVTGPTFARFRISNDPAARSPEGEAADGEVEDYLVYIRRGPVEIDIFEDASMDVTLMMPDGSSEVVSLTGPMEMHVYFEGQEEGDAVDDDGNGKDEVETEIVSLNLRGQSSMGDVQVSLNPDVPSKGVMEETVNATLGRLDILPFVPSQDDPFFVDSFFDISFEITIDFGSGPLVLINHDPLRLAGVITHKPPAECDEYTSTNTSPVALFDANGQSTGISIATTVLKPKPCYLDWGDAPDIAGTPMSYPTLAINNGARHRIVDNVFLGNTTIIDTTILRIDAEDDGQPTIDADGDDVLDLNDDEDGIRFLTWPLRPGRPAKIEVRASVDGYLSAWIDFGADGSWIEVDDYIAFDGAAAAGPILISAGTTVHEFQVPTSAKPNTKTYSRFRFATYPITTFEGYARDGEVEDYLVKIRSHPGIKWIQRPDETPLGIDIRVDSSDDIQRVLADDFECTSYGYITDVHLWGSWKNDDKGKITNIHLSIHSDDPISDEPGDSFSKPDKLLWEGDFSPDEFREKLYTKVEKGEFWWDPYRNVWLAPGDHEIWRVDINIHPKAAFLQEGSPKEPIVYWLDVAVRTDGGEFGWKTRRWPEHYNDDAVRNLLDDDGNHIGWQDLHYPDGHPLNEENPDDPPSIDMAFVLTTDNAVTGSGDLNGDHVVDLTDLAIYAGEYEPGVLQFSN